MGLLIEQLYEFLVQRYLKRVHGFKFQSLALPNGLIGNLSGPYVGKRDESTMLMSLGCSQIYRDQHWHNNQPLRIYGNPAYPLSIHLQAPDMSQTKSYT